jgi:transcriptional regulator with XRE-family HTH domain
MTEEDVVLEMQARIGDNIKNLRVHRKMTQTDLSKITGKTVANISDIENGNVNITIRTLVEMCQAMNVVCDIKFRTV